MGNSLIGVEHQKLVKFIIIEKSVFCSVFCVSLFGGKKLWLHNLVIFLCGIEMFRSNRLDYLVNETKIVFV